MSKGSINNTHLKVVPSQNLCEFIFGLENEDSMPENILNLYKKYSNAKSNKIIFSDPIPTEEINNSEEKIMQNLNSTCEKTNVNFNEFFIKDNKNFKKNKNYKGKDCFLTLYDLKWIGQILIKNNKSDKKKVYLHELLENSKLILPENEVIERNPILEERCIKLRQQQERREYNAMTKNVDSRRQHFPEDTIAYQMKQINRHLIAVLQFIFSVAAGFAFGFIGVELLIGNLDFGFRLLLGIICSLIIALAEIYFLAKQLNEEYDIKEEPIKNNIESNKKANEKKLHKD